LAANGDDDAMAAHAAPPPGFIRPALLPQRESAVWDDFDLDR
jgi:hypothetical protein